MRFVLKRKDASNQMRAKPRRKDGKPSRDILTAISPALQSRKIQDVQNGYELRANLTRKSGTISNR
jgi:hypothetical protein